MNIKLIKVKNVDTSGFYSNIPEGYVQEGFLQQEPRVGEKFWVGNYWKTSVVKEIIDENTFRTETSEYKIVRL